MYKQACKRNKRLQKNYYVTKDWHSVGTWYDEKRNCLKRVYPYRKNGVNMSKFWRKCCNRKIRRNKDFLYKNNEYRRYFNIWNKLF